MRTRKLVIGAVALVCVAGCSFGSDAPKAMPTTSSAVTADDAAEMKEGRDYDVVATLPEKIHGVRPHYSGVSPDGMVYGDAFIEDPDAERPVGPGSTLLTGRSSVFLLDPTLGKVTEVLDGAVRKEPSGVTGMDADDEWVVWLESPEGGFSSGRWTLYSYERGTGKTSKLGAHDDAIVVPKAQLGYETLPEINGDDVVMATSVIDRKDEIGKANQVLSAPLDGHAPLSELARGARSVDVGPEGFSYVDVTGALLFRDATSGKTTVIDSGNSGCRTFSSGVLVTCDPYGSGTKVRVRAKGGPTTTFGPFSGDIGYTDFESGWAKFVTDPDGDSKIYAIDTDRMKLFKVADTQGGWQLMGNDMALVAPFDGAKGDITLIKLR